LNINEKKERRIAWAMLILCPLSMVAMLAYVSAGTSPGQASGHPMVYLQLTCILWGIIMAILPMFRILRLVALPLWFAVMVYADMYMYVISLCLGMYMDHYWWANFTHVVSTMVVTAIVFMALCKMSSRSPPHVSFGSNGGIIVIMFFLGAAFGAIWEFMEGLTDLLSGYDYMIYGAIDNIGNLAADIVGVFLMIPVALFLLRRYGASEIASTFRIGRRNIDVTDV
jgi:hypothetical protein